MGGKPNLELKFSHHVIEHLGLKLYQNKPTNVVAELVSNCWDAYARNVWINISETDDRDGRFVAVMDDGCGMSRQDLAEKYLVIGKPKKRKQGSRYAMGRKGIGKLAPFGIATVVDVVSVSKEDATWIRIPLPALLDESANSDPTELSSYQPEIIFHAESLNDFPKVQDRTGQVSEFRQHIGDGSGTLILLQNLSTLRAISPDGIRAGLGRRFTVTLGRDNFNVTVNNTPITAEEALPEFELRIPPEGKLEDQVGGKTVRFWVGFVKSASWPSDEAGVGIYAHGKIAQDRPFTFGLKGREIFTRYMYGVVEADYLDEMPEDVISTDRSSIDWDNPIARQLYDWGQKKVRHWIEDYRNHREGDEARRVLELVDTKIASGELPKIRRQEREIISNLLAEVTPTLSKTDGTESAVTSAIVKAYLHQPTRELLQRLWGSFPKERDADGETFLAIVEKISEAAVPEALSIAVEFAERAYALTCLMDYQHSRGEPEMQKLLEKFPWIIQPGYEKLSANQQLKTAVTEAAKRGLSPARIDLSNPVNEETKPDFVFFNDLEDTTFVVVELKSPREDLNLENREQLHSYLTYLEQQFPFASVSGILVGSNGAGLKVRDPMRIMTWSDVLRESKRGHVGMLAAMLKTANPDPDDARLKAILEFGGEEVWEALERIAANDEGLATLLEGRGV